MTPRADRAGSLRPRWARSVAALRREAAAIGEGRRVSRPLDEADRCTEQPSGPVVSLTSYPARIGRVHLTLRSLLMQSMKPRRVELVLSTDEFPQRQLPQEITRLAERGVGVRWVEGNIRSFKKLVPLLESSPGMPPIVTADDDIIYPADWLEGLWSAHLTAPRTIWGTRGREILVRQGDVRPYREWPFADGTTPSSRTLLTGMGGILYPPGSLPPETRDMTTAMDLCPDADDIWFKACAMAHGTEIRQVGDEAADFPTRLRGQRGSLQAKNLHDGRNDQQFRRTFEHFGLVEALLAS